MSGVGGLSPRFLSGLAFLVLENLLIAGDNLLVGVLNGGGVDALFMTFIFYSAHMITLPFSEKEAPRWPRSAMIMCPIYVFALACSNLALSMTSITSTMIFGATSGVWALILGIVTKVESQSGYLGQRAFGAVVCIAGAALAAFGDAAAASSSEQQRESLLGDLFALLSSFLYAAYATGLRFYGDDGAKYPRRFFGVLGFWTFCFFSIPTAVYLVVASKQSAANHDDLQWTDVLAEKTGTSHGYKFLLICVAKALFDSVPTAHVFYQSVVRTTPTVASVGMSLGIPLGFLVDAFITGDLTHNHKALTQQIFGAVMATAGFIITTINSGDSSTSAKVQCAAPDATADDDDDLESQKKPTSSSLVEPLLAGVDAQASYGSSLLGQVRGGKNQSNYRKFLAALLRTRPTMM